MSEHIRLGTVAGFRLGVHWSVLVILWLFTWSLASTLPSSAPGRSALTYWVAGAIGAAVLLASLLAHELMHAVVARRAGIPVSDVTLWLFGGVTRLGGEAKTAWTEFRIAISGPLTSVALAGLFAAPAAGTPERGCRECRCGRGMVAVRHQPATGSVRPVARCAAGRRPGPQRLLVEPPRRTKSAARSVLRVAGASSDTCSSRWACSSSWSHRS